MWAGVISSSRDDNDKIDIDDNIIDIDIDIDSMH